MIKLKLSLWLVLSGNVGLLSCHRFQTIRTPTSSGIFGLENPSPYPLLPIRSALLPFGGIFRLFRKRRGVVLGVWFAKTFICWTAIVFRTEPFWGSNFYVALLPG
jgi:hypothetical protein